MESGEGSERVLMDVLRLAAQHACASPGNQERSIIEALAALRTASFMARSLFGASGASRAAIREADALSEAQIKDIRGALASFLGAAGYAQ